MAIRQVTSRSIKDGTNRTADIANFAITAVTLVLVVLVSSKEKTVQQEVTLQTGKGDIFRVNEATLNTSVTIASGDNASCAGPLTISTSGTVNLTVNGNLTIV